jgi:predicted nucleotidyltransferase
MKRDNVLKILADHQDELHRQFGVKSLALFGSVARADAIETSDVDLLVEFDRPIGLLHFIATQQHLETLLGVWKVDLVLRRAVLPELKEDIFAEAVDVF